MAFKVSIVGREELRRLRLAVPAAARRLLEAELAQGARAAAADARTMVPVRTGALRDGITSFGRGLSHVVGVVGPAARYAHFVEYGTVWHSARPFMRPAARREADRLNGRVRTIAAALPGAVR